ncbi:MAG TPA: glycoside hydrolase family 9 protein [Blastocatellia bacterium]|nr:glycoside hydrolase family 9 protein [Blastocatellia bacterium]
MRQKHIRRKNRLLMRAALYLLATLIIFTFRPQTHFSQTTFDYGDALEKAVWFFDANKCGPNVSADNVFSWRGACHLSDGAAASPARDLTGGFHDAGDHVKFGLPQGFSASVLGWSLYEYRAEFDSAGMTAKTLRTLKYFTDYFLRSHPNATTFYYQVGDGNADHGFWGSPENQTGSRPLFVATPSSPAVDILGQHAAALALMSINYRSTDAAYANQCLNAARELFDMARTSVASCSGAGCRGQDGGDFYNSTSHFDDLAWGAIWLHIATGEQSYLDPVDGWISQPNDGNDNPYQKRWTMAWDDMTLANLLKMHQLTGRTKYRDGLRWNLVWFRDTLQKTPSGLPWLDQWGVLRYASAEAGLGFLAYKLFGYNDFFNTGGFIVNYALGSNPRGGSFVTNYLANPPVHPHHRANEPVRGGPTRGMIGALVGGPASNDAWTDNVDDFRTNEVALDYNASFVFALAGRLYFANGGQPGTPPPPPPPPPMSPPGNGDGLRGTFFQGTALAGAPLLTRVDPTVNFNWAGGSPAPGVVPADQFSVRWEGQVEARSNELYTFHVTHDDGARLWVNDQQIINNWTDHAAIEDSGTIALQLGQRYTIRLEFYENGGDASATLAWSTPLGIEKQIIPQSQLYSVGGPPPTPDFTLSANPSSVNLTRGATANSAITITRLGGFTGSVALSASGLPSGVTASFNPASATGTSSTVTFTATTAATLGPATVTITGIGGGLTRATTINLTVIAQPTPDFTLSANPSSLTVNRGASGTSTITITRSGGFTGSVAFSASGLPTGVTASFSPTSTTGNSSTLTLAASNTATTGPATVTVTGAGGGLTRSVPISLTVNAPPTPDFTLSANPSSLTLNQGANGTSTITIPRTGGFASSVTLSASGLPSGVTASFSPSSTTGTSSTLTLSASSAATLGPATVTVTGTGGGLTRTTTIALTVSGGGNGGVTVTPVIIQSGPWFNEEALRLSNTAPLTALSITIVIQRTTGVSFNGHYNTVGSQILMSNNSTTTTITYQFNLAAGQTLGMSTDRLFAAQMNGAGTIHPMAGDTYTVTYTTGGVTFTQTGHF